MTTLLSYFVLIFGYMAFLVFIVGIAYRIWNWGRLPTGFSWGVFPQPTKWTVTSVIWKAFAWPTLFRGDSLLWVGAILFHVAILLLFVGHLGLFANMLAFMERLGISGDASYTIGIVAGIIAGAVLVFFTYRRSFIAKAKEISTFSDHLWLWFLLAVILLGIYARVFHGASSDTVREFGIGLLTFNPILPPANFWLLIHALSGEIFIIYSLLGKPRHLVGQFFTQYIMVSEKR